MAVETTHYFAPAPMPRRRRRAHRERAGARAGAAPMANAAFVASVPTGMPVWPAVLMAGQSPMHFASLDFHDGGAAPR